MKPKHALLGILALFIAAACSHQLQDEKNAYAPTVEESTWITERLLTIKRETATYHDIDAILRWKLALCAAPYNDPYPVAYKDTIVNVDSMYQVQQQLRESRSDDMDTHGKALYRLFVKAKLEYAHADGNPQPENQVIVKATYKPVALETAQPHSDKQAALGEDGKWYREGDPDDLYIMFRTDRKGIQTDAGWVYGIVSVKSDTVIAQGLISNCMGCHRKNEPDRLFGISQ